MPVEQTKGQLRVQPEVGDIPLLALLVDFVATHPKGTSLTVSHSGNVPESVGYAMISYQRGPNRFNIQMNVTRLREDGEFDEVFSHELAHLFDVTGFTCDGTHEPFADALATLLLQERPTTVEQVQPLIDRARKQLLPPRS